jgi:branched-chain amino acid transport system ATP-binding protein
VSELLAVDALRAGYGNIEVLHDVSIALDEGTLCAIVGANGAGKTTLLMTLAGVMPSRGGHVRFDGADITRTSSHARVKRGLVLVPEGRRMLPGMSVEENLQVAASVRGAKGFARIDGLFDRFPILRTRRNVPAGSLSGGEQQMLAIARALAIGPKRCCWTNRRWGSHQSSSTRSLRSSQRSAPAARRSCSSSKTRAAPWPSPTAPT